MKKTTKDLKYLLFIFFVWLITYLICTVFWKQQLGWDEVTYLATARGIVENLDFSSRYNTIMGLIKYPFPQHTHHYPFYSIYIAIFFKLFGISLHIAYFSTWFSVLITCIFIYFTMNLMTENNLFSFLTSISFLFLPRIINYCDSAMMEIPGCALLSVFTYLIFKDLAKRKMNPFLVGIVGIFLYLFKTLFIGVVIGFIFLIILSYNPKVMESLKIQNKLPVQLSLLIYSGMGGIIYFIFTKFIFLPLAPMMNFSRKQEDMGVYADFAGGFFHNPVNNTLENLNSFVKNIFLHYFPNYPLILIEGEEGFYGFGPSWCDYGLFMLILFYMVAFLFFSWGKLLPINRLFILFSTISILTFNVIFNLMVSTSIGQHCRDNMLYVPLLLISVAILLKPFFVKYNFINIFVILSFITLVYFPFLIGEIKADEWSKNTYHLQAHRNSEIVKKFIKGSTPSFIYFHTGTHTTWDSFPTRVILQEATASQINTINLKLPKPIEYLFLQPENKLFKENQELIFNGKPILNDSYVFQGADVENKVVVYKYKR